MAERRGVYRVLVGKPEGKTPLGDSDADGREILTLSTRNLFKNFSTPCM